MHKLNRLLTLILLPFFAQAQTKNFGGPYNFGIEFSPVDRAVAERFWTAYDNSENLINTVKPGDYVRNEYTPIKASHPYAKVVSQAVQQYIHDLPGWAKLKCATPDMNAYQQGRLVFSEPVKKLAPLVGGVRDGGKELDRQFPNLKAYWTAQRKKSGSENSIYACNFERKYGYDLNAGETNEALDMELIVKPEWQIVPEPRRIWVLRENNFAKVTAGLSAKNTRTGEVWHGTRFGKLDENGEEFGNMNNWPTTIPFFVIDDYLIPKASHGTSKGFPVPVARFDRVSGKILAYYDFGMLLLERFPADKPLVLTSRASERKMKEFIATRDLKAFGAPRALIASHLDQYVSASDMPASSPFWNYDRIPVGSVHFMINSFWEDGYSPAADGTVLLAVFSPSEIKELYTKGGAWINTYDDVRTHDYEQQETYSELLKGNCAFELMPQNFPVKMRLSHEIILGGSAGRAALAKAKIVPVISGKPQP